MNLLFELIKNTRPLRVLYHIGLFFIGGGISILYSGNFSQISFFEMFLIIFSIILSWVSSVFLNDSEDFNIDNISNKDRPIQKGILTIKESFYISIFLASLSIILALIIDIKIAILLVVYNIISVFYNKKPFRLKRILFFSTFLASLASFVIILIGFISYSNYKWTSVLEFPLNLFFLFLITYTISLPIKDLKDYAGDKEDGIKTVPVVFGIKKGRMIIGILIMISFLLGAFFTNFDKMIFISIIFGLVAFFILNLKMNNKFLFDSIKILNYIFILTFIYGLILVYTVYIKSLPF